MKRVNRRKRATATTGFSLSGLLKSVHGASLVKGRRAKRSKPHVQRKKGTARSLPPKMYWERVEGGYVLRQGGSNTTPRRQAHKRQRDARRKMYAGRRGS